MLIMDMLEILLTLRKTYYKNMISSDLCPVICSLTHDGNGQILNTNADTIAAELSVTLADLYMLV